MHLSGIYLDFSLLFPTFNEFPPLLVSPPANIAQVLHSSGGGQGGAEQLPRGEEGEGSDLVPAKRNQSTGKNLRSDVGILLLLLRERSAASSSSFLRSGHGNSTGLSRVVAVPVSHRSPRLYIRLYSFSFQRAVRFSKFRSIHQHSLHSRIDRFIAARIGEGRRDGWKTGRSTNKQQPSLDNPTTNDLSPSSTLVTKKNLSHDRVHVHVYLYIYIYMCIAYIYVYIYIHIHIRISCTHYRPRIGVNKRKYHWSLSLSLFLRFPELSHCHPTSASAAESITRFDRRTNDDRHERRHDSTRFDSTLGTTPWDRK